MKGVVNEKGGRLGDQDHHRASHVEDPGVNKQSLTTAGGEMGNEHLQVGEDTCGE